MGTAPNKVKAWFDEDPRPKCEQCLGRLKGLHAKSSLRASLRKGMVQGWLVERKGRCAHCQRNALTWCYQEASSDRDET